MNRVDKMLVVLYLAFIGMLGVGQANSADEFTFTSIDFPGSIATMAFEINPVGDVVGRYHSADGKVHGYVLSKGTYSSIDAPGAIFTLSIDINARGEIVGRYIDTGGMVHGYLLSNGAFTAVDFPGAIFTRASGINAKGMIVGNYEDTSGKFHGFLLNGGTFTTIDPPGSLFREQQEPGGQHRKPLILWNNDPIGSVSSSEKTLAFLQICEMAAFKLALILKALPF